jgi:hypothetical protein
MTRLFDRHFVVAGFFDRHFIMATFLGRHFYQVGFSNYTVGGLLTWFMFTWAGLLI